MHNKSKEQWNKEQSELYKDPRWQKKRLEIFQRDKFTCQFCKSKTNTLAIHHLEYHDNLKPWEYKDEELLCICDNCHKVETKDRKIYEISLLKILKKYKFSADNIQNLSRIVLSISENKSGNIELLKLISRNKECNKIAWKNAIQYIRIQKIKELLEK